MAAVSVSFDGTVLSLAQSSSDNGVWDKANSTQTPTQEDNFLWNGPVNQSNQVSNNVAGIEFEDDASIDVTTPKVILAKIMMANPGIIDLTIAKGLWYEIGEGVNGGTWNYDYYMAGLYAGEYPVRDTWQVLAIDPNEIAFRDGEAGTVALATTDYYAMICDAASQAKTDNMIHARLDYLTYGQGLTLVGGDGGDADGTLDDYLAFDFEDSTLDGRMGIILPGADENIINGWLNLGTATATVANDSNRFLVFPHHRVAEGFGGIRIGMENASNDINLTAYTFKGLGNASVKKFFDTAIGIAANLILIDDHGFETGDLVTYSDEGGTAPTGLTDATQYFVGVPGPNAFSLYVVGASVGRQNSFTDTSRVVLTADSAPGENHSFIRGPDTRLDYLVAGTTGVGHTLNSCSIDGARIVTFTSKAAMTGGFILRTGSVVLDGGSMDSVSVSTPTLEEGVAQFDLTATALGSDLSAMTFAAGDEGHAVRVTATGSPSWDHTLSGYWAPADLGWNFSTAQAFTSEQLNTDAAHGFTSGDAVYYNDEGGVETIGLTDGNKYYVNVVDTDTVTLHLTRAAAVAGSSAIDLTTSGSETQSLYSSKAAIFNDTSSGTLTITVSDGTAPSYRNASGATTVVNSDTTVTLTDLQNNTEVTVYDSGTGAEIATVEDVVGNQFQFSDVAANEVNIFIHHVAYYRADLNGFTIPSDDVSIPVSQVADPNYVND